MLIFAATLPYVFHNVYRCTCSSLSTV